MMPKQTKPCPECGGEGVTPKRYTDPPTSCETCGGSGAVAADEEAADAAQAEATGKKVAAE